MSRWTPTAPEVTRQAILMLGAALLIGLVLSEVPAVKTWLSEHWL